MNNEKLMQEMINMLKQIGSGVLLSRKRHKKLWDLVHRASEGNTVNTEKEILKALSKTKSMNFMELASLISGTTEQIHTGLMMLEIKREVKQIAPLAEDKDLGLVLQKRYILP